MYLKFLIANSEIIDFRKFLKSRKNILEIKSQRQIFKIFFLLRHTYFFFLSLGDFETRDLETRNVPGVIYKKKTSNYFAADRSGGVGLIIGKTIEPRTRRSREARTAELKWASGGENNLGYATAPAAFVFTRAIA